ncbi:hypothetical protein [Phenylobacterium sp.]|uniref:hypothetical protein n=1 Tax=Phenylobacterium sp. TaxID=1871053 RepID=UPI003563C5A7
MFEAASALCATNHGDPAKVLAAADATGWQHEQPEAQGILNLFNMQLSPSVRLKLVGADQLMLEAKEKSQSTSAGLLRTRKCSVVAGGLGSAGVVEALKRQFGRKPYAENPAIATYIYYDADDGRHFLARDQKQIGAQDLLKHTVVEMTAGAVAGNYGVFYEESSLAPRPGTNPPE